MITSEQQICHPVMSAFLEKYGASDIIKYEINGSYYHNFSFGERKFLIINYEVPSWSGHSLNSDGICRTTALREIVTKNNFEKYANFDNTFIRNKTITSLSDLGTELKHILV